MTSGDDAPSGSTDSHAPAGPFMGRRSFLALGGMAAASAMAVSTLAVLPGCATADESGLMSLFGSRIAAVRALGVIVVTEGPLAGAAPADVVAMLPADGIETSVDGARLVIEVEQPDAFAASLTEQSAAELAGGALEMVSGYPLTPTEMALAAAVAMSTS